MFRTIIPVSLRSPLLRLAGVLAVLLPTSNASSGASLGPDSDRAGATILYGFTGGPDGGGPFGALVRDSQGNLYGTTAAGGMPGCDSPIDAPGCGVVYELSPPVTAHGAWRETVLYAFTGGADGNGPLSTLARDTAGNLFGTTEAGGAGTRGCANGCGIVFEISPPPGGNGAWTETVLHRFGTGATDGTFPVAGVVEDANGNLYGTTPSGGARDLGTIFEISPQGGGWSETILHDFKPSDGSGPVAPLLLDTDGAFYGTAELGAAGGTICNSLGNCGTVFKLSPPSDRQGKWGFSVLFRIPERGQDGLYPMAALVKDEQGRLLGTMDNGGIHHREQANGTVFRLSPPSGSKQSWTLRTLLYFTTVGSYPAAPVLLGGHHTLYGTTMQAGTGIKDGNGLVYALAPSRDGSAWLETPLFSFPAARDGFFPMAGVIADPEGRLYGTASSGGKSCSVPFCGTVYRVTPP